MGICVLSVQLDAHTMWVELSDGRTLGIPIALFPRLLHASPEQRGRVEVSCIGRHWDDIDQDISVAALLAGCGDATRETDKAA